MIDKYANERPPVLEISKFKTAAIQSDTNDVNLIDKRSNNIMHLDGYDFIAKKTDLEA